MGRQLHLVEYTYTHLVVWSEGVHVCTARTFDGESRGQRAEGGHRMVENIIIHHRPIRQSALSETGRSYSVGVCEIARAPGVLYRPRSHSRSALVRDYVIATFYGTTALCCGTAGRRCSPRPLSTQRVTRVRLQDSICRPSICLEPLSERCHRQD